MIERGVAYADLVANTAYAARIGSGNIILERAEAVPGVPVRGRVEARSYQVCVGW